MPFDERTHEQINDYINDLFAPEDDALRWIRAELVRQEMPMIHIQPYEGRLLQMLMLSCGTRKAVEIGTLAGYSAVWMARALPSENGSKLYTLEKSAKHAAVSRESFAHAGVSERIELLEGDALISLKKLSAQAPFDFVFIDADKAGYPAYLDWAVKNLRAGGIVAAHNALRHGRILNPESADDSAVHAFNAALAQHPKLESYIMPIGDGMAVGVKRG